MLGHSGRLSPSPCPKHFATYRSPALTGSATLLPYPATLLNNRGDGTLQIHFVTSETRRFQYEL